MSEYKARGRGDVSIIVPTYKEKENLRPLTERIFETLSKTALNAEVVVVDDNSRDGSVELVEQLQTEGFNVRILVRTTERGLSSAVVHGFRSAKYDTLVCMDADLQHDPKYLPSVIDPVILNEADFTVGSRNVDGGAVEDWPLIRRLISAGATLAARPLAACSDPMSGFFCLSRETFVGGLKRLNPMGYKIGLELMVRCNCKRIKEVPIVFRDREAGESKLTMKQNLLYLRQLLGLYWDKYPLLVLFVVLLGFAILYGLYTVLL